MTEVSGKHEQLTIVPGHVRAEAVFWILSKEVGRQQAAQDANGCFKDLDLDFFVKRDGVNHGLDGFRKSLMVPKHDEGVKGIDQSKGVVTADIVAS